MNPIFLTLYLGLKTPLFKFIDLFCGTGGLRLGLEQALAELKIPSECILSAEIDKKACESYELNFGENPYRDVKAVTNIPKYDMLLAGFPCQAFSYAGNQKGFEDTRGTLFFDVARILKESKPKYFLLENVRGLVTHDKGATFETIKNTLTELGYALNYLILNSSHYDVPQNRVRIYILGILNVPEVRLTLSSDLGSSDSHKFKENFQTDLFNLENNFKLVKDILEDQVDPKYLCSPSFTDKVTKALHGNLDKIHGYRLTDYRGGNALHSWELDLKGPCTEDEIDFMNALLLNRRRSIFGTHKDGKSLTQEQILTFYDAKKFDLVTPTLIEKGYLQITHEGYKPVCGNMSFEVFKFLDPNSISITLTASDSNRLGIYHNGQLRRITPRECARIQGYPDSYKLINDQAVYKQMGNGVSVPVVKAVSLDFFKTNEIFDFYGLKKII